MNSSPITEYGPLYSLIMSSPEDVNDWSTERLNDYFKTLRECGKDTYDRMKELSREFTVLREKNLELEETVTLLHQNLDQQRAAMQEGDVEMYRMICKEQYKSFWEDLDSASQEFFVTAHYLYERSKAQNTDFSPVIIEFCRIFENELLEKIFKEFVTHQATLNRVFTYQNFVFKKVTNAISAEKNNGFFFLSSMDMLKLLSCMGRTYNNGYEKELQEHLYRNGFDTDKISNKINFIDPAKAYVNNFRNQAAHPNFLKEAVASACKDQTDNLVNRFISAKNK